MNVIAFLKRVKHHFVTRDVGQQTQLELRIIRRDQFVAGFSHERAPDSPPQLSANRNVLQVRIARRETAGCRDGLIERTMNAPVARDLVRQRIRVHALQFFQLAIFDDQSWQLVRQRQLFEHRFARRHATRRSLAAGNDVERFEAFADLFRRIDVEFTAGELADSARQLFKLCT